MMQALWRGLTVAVLLLCGLTTTAGASLGQSPGEHYIVIVKDEQRLYLAQGDPKAPVKTDVIKHFPVTTGGIWLLKGLETPSGYYTIVDKTNNPVQGGYDFTGTGDVTLTPYFMRLNVPNRPSIGIHTYTGLWLNLGRFGATGGQTTHGCISGPPQAILDLYKHYVQPGKTRVWVVDHASEAFKDVPAPSPPTVTEVNGKTWQAVQSPTKQQFYSVDMLRSDLGWAVAGDVTVDGDKYGWRSQIYRWDGREWKLEANVPYWLNDLQMLDEDEGWAVGNNYLGGLHRKAGRWRQVEPSDIETDEFYVSTVGVVSPDAAWTAGAGGEIWYWDGSKFNWDGDSPEVNKTIRSISMLDSRQGIMVGGGWDTTSKAKETIPMIGHYNGQSWDRVESPVDELFYGVDMLSEEDAWAVGSNGAIIHWNGQSWESVKSPTKARLSDVEMHNASDGWAVGDQKGEALHWDGKSWSRVKLPVDEKFYELSVLEDGTAMAVGSGGAIIQLVDAAGVSQPQGKQEPKTTAGVQPTPEAGSEPDDVEAGAEVERIEPRAESTAAPQEAAVQLGDEEATPAAEEKQAQASIQQEPAGQATPSPVATQGVTPGSDVQPVGRSGDEGFPVQGTILGTVVLLVLGGIAGVIVLANRR